jgi:hypothetical protein
MHFLKQLILDKLLVWKHDIHLQNLNMEISHQ